MARERGWQGEAEKLQTAKCCWKVAAAEKPVQAAKLGGSQFSFSSPLSLSTSCGHCPPWQEYAAHAQMPREMQAEAQRRAKAKAKAEPKANVRISPSSEFAVYNFITFKLNAFSCRFSCPGGLNGPPPSCPHSPAAWLPCLADKQFAQVKVIKFLSITPLCALKPASFTLTNWRSDVPHASSAWAKSNRDGEGG